MAWHYVVTDAAGWTIPFSQEQTDNAREVWDFLRNAGWTEEAAAGVLGNFQAESYINPGQWEIGYNYSMSRGTGLGQWTPATKVSDYVGSTNHDAMANGQKQMELLISEPGQYSDYYLNPDGSSTYYNESGLPYLDTMSAYSAGTGTVGEMTKLWAICWERPGSTYYASSIHGRISAAQHWYDEFHGSGPEPSEDDIIPVLFFTKCIK